jgi:methyl-accepting chemotaxis protein
MSGGAAKEIGALLESSISKVERVVNETKARVSELSATAQSKVEKGGDTAKKCGDILQVIVSNVSEVSQMVADIATASTEQANGVAQIGQAMGQLDAATHQNATAAQQTSQTAEQLTSQANELKQIVSVLIELSKGQASKRLASAAKTPSYTKAVYTPEKAGPTNVVPFAPRKPDTAQSDSKAVRSEAKVANGDPIPHEDDNRFVDV